MRIWEDYLHWRVILSWPVLASLVTAFLAIGGIALALDDYWAANVFFIAVAVLCVCKTLHLALSSSEGPITRFVFVFFVCGCLVTATWFSVVAVLHFGGKKHNAAWLMSPKRGAVRDTSKKLPETERQVPNETHSAAPPQQIISAPQVSAPKGIAIGRDNLGTATVNNYGPVQRKLSPEQASKLAKLIDAPTHGFEGIDCIMGDAESHRFAQQLWDIFKKENWNVGLMVAQSVMQKNVSGIFVAISPEDVSAPPDGAMRVDAAFKALGLNVHGMTLNTLPKGHWSVFVGTQPPFESVDKSGWRGGWPIQAVLWLEWGRFSRQAHNLIRVPHISPLRCGKSFLHPSPSASSQARFRLLSKSRSITLRSSAFSRD